MAKVVVSEMGCTDDMAKMESAETKLSNSTIGRNKNKCPTLHSTIHKDFFATLRTNELTRDKCKMFKVCFGTEGEVGMAIEKVKEKLQR
jgi:hypothetical protein